jgi:hypothetical protein
VRGKGIVIDHLTPSLPSGRDRLSPQERGELGEGARYTVRRLNGEN